MEDKIDKVVDKVVKEEDAEPKINLDKFSEKNKEKEDTELDELSALKKQLEQERADKLAAEDKANKFKRSFDNKASEAAKLTARLRDTQKDLETPNEELANYKEKVEQLEFDNRKRDLLYSLTENLGTSKEMAGKFVSAVYNEDTNGLVVADLELAMRELVDEVKAISYTNGYETRETELASGKPRSLGKTEPMNVAEKKRQEFLNSRKRR